MLSGQRSSSTISRRSSTRRPDRSDSADRAAGEPARRSIAGSVTHQVSERPRFRFGRTTSTRATRTAASAAPRWSRAGDEVQASRAAGHLHAADDHPADAREPVSDAVRPRAGADRQRLAEPRASSSPARSPGGGAQGDLLRTETHIQMNESLSWTKGTHLVQTGFQLPDWSRRGFYDQDQFRRHFLLRQA